jgi:hypothetical protein
MEPRVHGVRHEDDADGEAGRATQEPTHSMTAGKSQTEVSTTRNVLGAVATTNAGAVTHHA